VVGAASSGKVMVLTVDDASAVRRSTASTKVDDPIAHEMVAVFHETEAPRRKTRRRRARGRSARSG
jgi:hypothetical protein